MEREKPVVAYCRVSTLEQKRRGYGIDIQVRDVTLFAQGQGLFIRRFYKDEAESGVAEDRRALQKLLRDCQTGRIGTVVIPSLDRLSRDVRLAENLFHRFEQLGVEVLIADMPNYNGKDRKDVLIRQIREEIAEENRKEIIERLWKGRQERVRRGLSGGTGRPGLSGRWQLYWVAASFIGKESCGTERRMGKTKALPFWKSKAGRPDCTIESGKVLL